MTKREHALDAAARGLRVFPQQGKIPRIKAWPTNASAKPSVIERWWKRWPDADIGVALDDDVYVFDCDTPEAIDAVRELGLPRTLTVRTARGEHRYFRVPHRLRRLVPRPGAAGWGSIEGKRSPGPVTWAGSVHPSGHVYTLAADAPIAPMPAKLVARIGAFTETVGYDEATPAERAEWDLARSACTPSRTGLSLWAALIQDASADLALALRALRLDLPNMPAGWADRFFSAAAYLGPHIASGTLGFDDTIGELTAVLHELDTEGGDPTHVLRSIERGLAVGARGASA